LHALIPSSEGGESLFADGLALAEHLRGRGPDAFRAADPHCGAFSTIAPATRICMRSDR